MNLIEITKGYEPKQNEQTEQMKSLPDTTDKWKQLAKEQAASLELVTEERRVTGEKSEDERVYPEISGKDTQAENGKTEFILRESRNARRNSEIKRRNSSFDNRTVRNAEVESIASAEQRRFEKQKRLEEQERTRAARRRNKRRSGPEL